MLRAQEVPSVGSSGLSRRSQRSLPPVEAPSRSGPPVRLRYVVLVGLLGSLGVWLYPRAHQAWRLHDLGVTLANHAACMVGPTGPALLRDGAARHDPAQLSELLRRRVVQADPGERPFAACATLADAFDVPVRARQAYTRTASEFAEHHGSQAKAGQFSVADFAFGDSDLERVAERAWPFVRDGHARLIVASAHAKEASHPAVSVVPKAGRGLPSSAYALRSTRKIGAGFLGVFGAGVNAETRVTYDGGITWIAGGREAASDLLDHCQVDPNGAAFSLSRTDAGRHVVLSQRSDAPPMAALLGEPEERLRSIACDERALVAVLGRREADDVHWRFRLCPFRRECRDLGLPPGLVLDHAAVDVTRIAGDTVLLVSRGGISRVSSSRDDGRTWAPLTVAFDAVGARWPAGAAPARLLTLGDHVLAFGRPFQESGSYALLVSSDHGAAFRAPAAESDTAVPGTLLGPLAARQLAPR